MNIHNTELIKQNEHAKAVRANLGMAPSSAVNIGIRVSRRQIELEAENSELRRSVDKLASKLRAMTGSQRAEMAAELKQRRTEAKKLKLSLADAHARILSQAETICNLTAAAEEPDTDPMDEGVPTSHFRKPIFSIIQDVLRDFPDVTWEEVKSIRRERRLIEPRQACIHAVHEQRPDLSLPAIGRHFGRDHTTILYTVRKMAGTLPSRRNPEPGAPIEFIQT